MQLGSTATYSVTNPMKLTAWLQVLLQTVLSHFWDNKKVIVRNKLFHKFHFQFHRSTQAHKTRLTPWYSVFLEQSVTMFNKNLFETMFNSVITTDRQWRLPSYFQFIRRVHGKFIHNRALPISKLWYRLGHPNIGDVASFKFRQNNLLEKLLKIAAKISRTGSVGVQNVWGHTRSYKCDQLEIYFHPPSLGWYRIFIHSLYVAPIFDRRNDIYIYIYRVIKKSLCTRWLQ
jgi:hypothetical protein